MHYTFICLTHNPHGSAGGFPGLLHGWSGNRYVLQPLLGSDPCTLRFCEEMQQQTHLSTKQTQVYLEKPPPGRVLCQQLIKKNPCEYAWKAITKNICICTYSWLNLETQKLICYLFSQYMTCRSMFTLKTNIWLSMRTSLSVDGGSVCASATKPIGRRTERVEPGTRAGRQRILPVTWITWHKQRTTCLDPLHPRSFMQDEMRGRRMNLKYMTIINIH